MTMAAFDADAVAARRTFGCCAALRDEARHAGTALPELSMGMSGDYPWRSRKAPRWSGWEPSSSENAIMTDDEFPSDTERRSRPGFPPRLPGLRRCSGRRLQAAGGRGNGSGAPRAAKLDERLQGFQEQLRAFRERERAMNDALHRGPAAARGRTGRQAEREAEAHSAGSRAESRRHGGGGSGRGAPGPRAADSLQPPVRGLYGELPRLCSSGSWGRSKGCRHTPRSPTRCRPRCCSNVTHDRIGPAL